MAIALSPVALLRRGATSFLHTVVHAPPLLSIGTQIPVSLASGCKPGHNPSMAKEASSRRSSAPRSDREVFSAAENGVFVPGAPVLITLSAPREKFWGAIITVSQ